MTRTAGKIRNLLFLDCDAEINRQKEQLRKIIFHKLKKRGAIIALSGGIDSSVVGALLVKALGKDKVFGLSLPEKEANKETRNLSDEIIAYLGIRSDTVDISPILEATGCYRKKDEAIREIFPEYGDGYLNKMVLDVSGKFRYFKLVIQSPEGEIQEKRLAASSYLKILSASNFKQRVRKMLEYHYADFYNFAVIGTSNRQEYDQGFFVKGGDGLADVKPIAHLYKTMVYQLASTLNIPIEIQNRPPTTDTYSMPQSQEEFYFSVPYDIFDICLCGQNHGLPLSQIAEEAGLTEAQTIQVLEDIGNKRKATQYLHLSPVLLEQVPEIKDDFLKTSCRHNISLNPSSSAGI